MDYAFVLLAILVVLNGAEGDWRDDPNRLEVVGVDLRRGGEPQRHRIPARFHRTRSQQRRTPVVITAPTKVYMAKEDPASYYKDAPVVITARHYKKSDPETPYKITHTVGKAKVYNQRRLKYRNGVKNKRKMHQRYRSLDDNTIPGNTQDVCIRCPIEKILVAMKGKERARLAPPTLYDCNGNIAKEARFQPLYGPTIGASLKEGTHTTVGNIMLGNKALKLCQYRNTVIVNRCPQLKIPSGVVAFCPKGGSWGSVCRFTCSHPISVLNLKGPSRIKCKDDLTWSSEPPVCNIPKSDQSWCEMPYTPKSTQLSCNTFGQNQGEDFPEGTECGVSCDEEDDSNELRPSIFCRRGLWEGELPSCSIRRRHHNGRRSRETVNL